MIHIDDLGALGTGGDDTSAFLAFRQIALANPNALDATLVLSPNRHYTYSVNTWMQGWKSLRIIGSGAKLECIADEQLAAIRRFLRQLKV